MDIVKCKECVASGQKSRVYGGGAGRMTCVGFTPYYDEDGKHHFHNPNVFTTGYHCSKGHSWVEKTRSSCWCGWPEKKNED